MDTLMWEPVVQKIQHAGDARTQLVPVMDVLPKRLHINGMVMKVLHSLGCIVTHENNNDDDKTIDKNTNYKKSPWKVCECWTKLKSVIVRELF